MPRYIITTRAIRHWALSNVAAHGSTHIAGRPCKPAYCPIAKYIMGTYPTVSHVNVHNRRIWITSRDGVSTCRHYRTADRLGRLVAEIDALGRTTTEITSVRLVSIIDYIMGLDHE